jgi:transcriptional regulator GlxA family with amidase domain
MNTKDEDFGDTSPEPEDTPPGRPDLRVGFILMNQFTLVPVAGLVDSLRFAADKSFRSRQIYCQWDWMTCNDQPVTASCGMPILPTKPLADLESYDYVVLAGGLLHETRNPPGWLLDALRKVHAAGIPIIALCSGSFVLGNAGLLDGRRCAVHFTIREEFAERFPLATALIDKSYVDDEGIVTCPGGTAIDLAASMIRRHCGEIRAQKGLKYLLADSAIEKSPEHESNSEPHVYQNEIVRKAIVFMRANLGTAATLKEVADHAGTSPRQLHRAFLNNTNDAPANYWRKLRLEYARKRLADTSHNVTTIAIESGFSDASHFILWFRKQYGETPSIYRKRRHEVERLLSAT